MFGTNPSKLILVALCLVWICVQTSQQVVFAAGDQMVAEEFEDELEDEIEDELEDEIEDELEDEIEDELEDEIEDELEDEIEDELEDEIEDELEDEIEDELEDEIEDELEDEIEDELEDEIEDELEDEIEDELEDEIEDELEDEIEDELEDEIEDELEDEIEDELEDEIEDELEDEIDDELEEEFEDELEEEFDEEIEEEFEDEFEEEFEDELEEEFEEDFDEGLEVDIEDRLDIESQLVEQIEDQVEVALDLVFDGEGREALSEEWIVLAEPESLKELESLGYLVGDTESLDAMGYVIGTIEAPKTFDPGQTEIAGLQLLNSPTVAVDRNVIYRPVAQSSVDLPEALSSSPEQSAQRPVGMIDSAVDRSHEVFGDTRIVEKLFYRATSAPDFSHGTAIASLLVSQAKDIEIYNAAIFSQDDDGEAYSSLFSLVRALNWLISQDIHLMNMSLSGPHSPVLEKAISQACNQEVVIVAAVGNAGPMAKPGYPSAYECTIAVTAVDEENQPYYRAGRGHHVDFASRGVRVTHAQPGGYGVSTGTSFAAPAVTAVLAGERDLLGRDFLTSQAIDLGPPGKDPVFGYGLIQVR